MKQGIYEWCALLLDLIFLSLLHIVTIFISLGLLAGTASIAVYRVCFKRISARDQGVFRDYISAVKENFRQSIPLNVLFVTGIYLLWFYIANGHSQQLLGFFVSRNLFILLVAAFFVFSALLYFIPLLAYFHTSLPKAIVAAFALPMNYLLVTVLLYLCLAGFAILVKLTAGFALLFFVGGYSYISAKILKNVFDRHQQNKGDS